MGGLFGASLGGLGWSPADCTAMVIRYNTWIAQLTQDDSASQNLGGDSIPPPEDVMKILRLSLQYFLDAGTSANPIPWLGCAQSGKFAPCKDCRGVGTGQSPLFLTKVFKVSTESSEGCPSTSSECGTNSQGVPEMAGPGWRKGPSPPPKKKNPPLPQMVLATPTPEGYCQWAPVDDQGVPEELPWCAM